MVFGNAAFGLVDWLLTGTSGGNVLVIDQSGGHFINDVIIGLTYLTGRMRRYKFRNVREL